jgi:hypothetical protein
MSWITFGKDRYHQHIEMENWCSNHFGPGNWISEPNVKDWTGMQVNWTIHSMFGNTTFAFKEPKNLTMFLLVWA